MFGSIRNRLIMIAILIVTAAIYLIPREITIRERAPNGVMRDVKVKKVPIKYGLDLQGGMHLALELDQSQKVSADPGGDIQKALQVLRKRVDEFGVTEPVVQQSGNDRIVVELAGITDPARAKAVVQKAAFLEFRITDKTSALDKALPAMDRALRQLGLNVPAAQTKQPSSVQKLLGDTTKAAQDTAATTGGVLSSLILPAAAVGLAGTPGEFAVLETAYPRVDSLLNLAEVKTYWPRNIDLLWSGQPLATGVNQYRLLYAVDSRPIITGENLVDATAAIDPLTNGPIVRFELDRAGGRKFGTETSKHVNDFMAIVLDARVQGRPPVIQTRIERSGQITMGNRSLQEAQDLALTLKAGALPVPLKVVEEAQVGASLGQDSINSGVRAGLVGTLLVILIMIGYYAFSGVLAVIGLALYLLFTLGAVAMLGATLTLPGLAGLVLSIGLAVDANVLIFERIREELALGKTPRLASDEGFHRAMNAIVDSNVCTIITAFFLYQFGTQSVRGFAVTLIIGTLASMITAIFVTRTFFLIWLAKRTSTRPMSI
jgi:preprotein translocase subunit SecD